MASRRIEYMEIGTIQSAKRNPKGHDIESIKASYRRFAAQDSPVLDERTSRLLTGHGRIEALQALRDAGEGAPEGIEVREGKWFVPVQRGGQTKDDSEAEAYIVAANRLTEVGGWDSAELAIMLSDVSDWEGIGFAGLDDQNLVEILGADVDLDSLGEEDVDCSDDNEDEEDDLDDEIPESIDRPSFEPGEVRKVGRHTIACCDCIEYMKTLKDESIDAIVTDPPYGVGMDMGTQGKWDASVPGLEWAEQCLRVLKPGGHMVAFSATRTVHRLTTAIEDAGFEIRDQIGITQYQGFPKSMNIAKAIDKELGVEPIVVGTETRYNEASGITDAGRGERKLIERNITKGNSDEAKKWDGFGTALKPAFEPAVLARKLISEKTVAGNILKHGTGGLNIDACRIEPGDKAWPGPSDIHSGYPNGPGGKSDPKNGWGGARSEDVRPDSWSMDKGRWPANIYHCPKPAQSEKTAGLDSYSETAANEVTGRKKGSAGAKHARSGRTGNSSNFHPTVKPSKVMKWLCRLVGGKPGSVILDSFLGSGTTMLSAEREGFVCIGIEKSGEFAALSEARVRHVLDE